MLQQIFELPADNPQLSADKRSLYQLLAAAITSITVFQFLTGIGILVIAVLALAGYFDIPENISLLFVVASINILVSLLHLPMFPLLRSGRLELIALLFMFLNGTFSAAQILLWQDILWFPFALVFSAVIVLSITRGLPAGYKIVIAAYGAALLFAVIIVNSQVTYPRLSLANLNNYAAFAIYLLFTAAMAAIGVVNGLIKFQTLSRKLVSVFTIVAVTTIFVFIIIGSIINYIDSRNRAFEQLETISNLKAAQITLVLGSLEKQAAQPLNDITISQIMETTMSSDAKSPVESINIRLVRSYLTRLQQQTIIDEYLLTDANGVVIISTNVSNESLDLSGFTFVEKARAQKSFAIEENFPGASQKISLLVLHPILLQEQFAGVLVLRTNFNAINEVTTIIPGTSPTLETYLVSQVGGFVIPATSTRQETDEINTYPAQQAFSNNILRGSNTYTNYSGKNVFGHYAWVPEVESLLISEIDQQEVISGIANSLPVYVSIGLVMVLLVLTIVILTSQSITIPIQEFSEKAAALAGGELSIRIASERQDELGALAASFNTMAGELETTVRTLETKVEERTKDLQKQANYLRIAAEVARDATISQDPDELLNRAAQLILDRFNFYHTGIFLVDADREYAILRASPTEAGRKMLERGHRLRLGQVGLVGYAAATGAPRIALNTGEDIAYFNNPLLPNTRSEVAIPLKLDNKVLGVLDVQSTQPEAFTQDDVATLQVMADQLALAIQRVELVSTMQRNLEELETTYRAFTSESWEKFSQEQDFKPGYLFDGWKITPLESFPANLQNALSKGRTVIIPPKQESDGATAVTPLKLREQVIGGIALRFQTPVIDPDTIGLIEETASRLAVALENARLYEETQHLVQRERAVSEISSRITTSFNIENILRTAVIEIGKRMPDAEVIVQLESTKD